MASKIHPTAVIHPSAEIGDDVEIGPYCVIHEGGVKIGAGSWLQNHVTMAGPLVVGRNNRFFAYASIGQQTQDLKFRGGPTHCEIGDNNTFREFVTVNSSTSDEDRTIIGSDNHILTYSHVAHDCKVGNHCIFSNNSTLGGHVVVEHWVVLGGMTGIHQFCRIGKHAMTGGCTKIVQDVPPFMIADGNPCEVRSVNVIGMQRRGFSEDAVRAIKYAHRFLYRKNLNIQQALTEIRELDDVEGVLDAMKVFVDQSDRGIIR